MPVWQFQSQLNPNQTVSVPPEVAAHLRPEETVQVVLMAGESDDAAWKQLAAEHFLNGYAPGDEIYDKVLPSGTGLTGLQPQHHDLDDCIGTWEDNPDVESALKAQRHIDRKLWQ